VISATRPPFDAIRLPDDEPALLHLCWMLHNQCNHRCTYCAEVNWGGSHRWLKLDAAIGFVERVLAHYPDRRIMISFTGGEPTLWPDFGPFVEWLKGRGVLIGMTTNGTKPLAFFEKYAQFFQWISFSFHPEFTRPEKFLANIAESSKESDVTIRAMMPAEPSLWQKSRDLIDLATQWNAEKKFSSYVGCDVVPIAVGFGTEHTRPTEYSPAQSEFFRETKIHFDGNVKREPRLNPLNRIGFSTVKTPERLEVLDTTKLLSQNQTDFRGWTCDIGLEQLFIDEKGEIVRAGCRVGGTLGHIFDADLKFPTAPVRCSKSYCHCNTDILTSKRSPEWLEQIEKRSESPLNEATHRFQLIHQKASGARSRWKYGERPSLTNLPVFALTYLTVAFDRVKKVRVRFDFWRSLSMGSIRETLTIEKIVRRLLKPYYFLRFQFQKRILRRTDMKKTNR
jgi:organic radical activating enzyme